MLRFLSRRRILAFKSDVGFSLPYTFDPSALGDGALPSPWIGGADTWEISSGVVINTPNTGVELLTDGGLEATYTGGLCDSLTKSAGVTAAESADAHEGSKAQSMTPSANNDAISFPNVVPTIHKWYHFRTWGKRTVGSSSNVAPRIVQTSGVPVAASVGKVHNDADYAVRHVTKRANNTNPFTVSPAYQIGATGFDTILSDECSLKEIILVPKIINSGEVDHIVKSKWDWINGTISGTIAKCNAEGTSFLVAYYWTAAKNPYVYCVLDQCIEGVWSNLIATWSNSPTEGAGDVPTSSQWLTISISGTTAKLYHNEIQVGEDKTINAALADNQYVGVYDSGGGSQLAAFFVDAS